MTRIAATQPSGWKQGAMTATMRDVAALAGVSIKTVSNVIHSYPYVRRETRERVENAIDDLGYRLNYNASSLRSGHPEAIAIVLPNLEGAATANFLRDVVRLASACGISVHIESPKFAPSDCFAHLESRGKCS